MSMDNMHEEIVASWDKAMLSNQIPNLHNIIEQLIKLMTDGILSQEYESLQFLFENGAKRIEAWGNRLDLENHEDYYRVFSYAAFWMSKKISGRLFISQQKEDKAQKKYEEIKLLENSKYITPLLQLLEQNGELPQGSIAEKLSISTQALSNLLRRYEQYKLWDYNRYGRHNYYHLTNEGKNYLNNIERRNSKDSGDIAHILTCILECFAEEACRSVPDIDNIIHEINKLLGNTQVVFGNEADKLAIRKCMRRIRKNNRRKEYVLDYCSEKYAYSVIDVIDLGEEDYFLMENDYLEEPEEVYLSGNL